MKTIVVLFLGCFALGCTKSGKETIEAMRKSACDGDVAGFFAHVDKTELGKNVGARLLEDGLEKSGMNALPEPGKSVAVAAFKKRFEDLAPQEIAASYTQFEDDIKKRTDGDLCHMKVGETVGEKDHTATVAITTPSGLRKHWVMQKHGDVWLFSDLIYVGGP